MKKIYLFILIISTTFGHSQTIVEKYPNGQIMSEISYKDSVKHGISKYYFEDGKIDAIVEFENGELKGTIKEFYETGYRYRTIDTKTLKAIIYSRDSSTFYKGTYDSREFIRNGLWENWEIKSNFKRFTWTYLNDIKHGPYIGHRKDGTIEATGHYYNGTIADTLKIFDKKGVLQEMQIWKVDEDGKSSTNVNTIYLSDIKSDGTPEMIDGVLYMWQNGKKVKL
jgi:antitoxin component YwqK of YwqJK toxin-antitoxin module